MSPGSTGVRNQSAQRQRFKQDCDALLSRDRWHELLHRSLGMRVKGRLRLCLDRALFTPCLEEHKQQVNIDDDERLDTTNLSIEVHAGRPKLGNRGK